VLIKKKSSTILVPCLLVAAGIIAGVLSNNMGVIGLCPVVACAQYGAAAIYPRSSVNFLRVSMVINSSLWAVYCIVLKNYVNALANIVLAIVAVIAIIKSVCKKETEGRNE
ncbi:MAG TPA: YgjV family protein, partial [Bacillota bacterium]|nr:YgjV family protein [Bacillota bacterium]